MCIASTPQVSRARCSVLQLCGIQPSSTVVQVGAQESAKRSLCSLPAPTLESRTPLGPPAVTMLSHRKHIISQLKSQKTHYFSRQEKEILFPVAPEGRQTEHMSPCTPPTPTHQSRVAQAWRPKRVWIDRQETDRFVEGHVADR